MGLVTLNQVKYYLGINVANIEHDEFLEGTETVEGIIDIVSGEFEEAIGNDVEKTERTVWLDGSGWSDQPLSYWPVISLVGDTEAARLACLQSRSQVTEAWADLVTDEDLIYFDPEKPWAITLLDGNVFPSGTKNVRVRYYSGYSEIPSEITLAVLERIALKYMESKHGESRLGVSSTGSGGMASQNQSFSDNQKRWDAVVRKYGRVM
jgi:hypothetical protein